MKTYSAMRLVSVVTAANVLIASGFAIAGIFVPKSVLPAGYDPTNASLIFAMYAAARTIPLALFVLIAIYRRSTSALLVLGTLAGAVQLVDAAIGAVQGDLGKSIGPLIIAALQFLAIRTMRNSMRPDT